MNIYSYDNFPIIEAIGSLDKCSKNKGKYKIYYYKNFATFDIETSTIIERDKDNEIISANAIIYTWQFCLNGYICFGRDIQDYKKLVKRLYKELSLNDNTLVIYVHNLSYEFQFLRSYFPLADYFAVKNRVVLSSTMWGCEYRCSYKLSNMSLAKFCENMNVTHKKLSGIEFDYKKIRTKDTPLTDKEIEYCINDVLGLWEAIKIKCQNDNDNMATIPLTSTGYVRRDCRNAMRKNKNNRDYFLNSELSDYTYKLIKSCARGGNTHANRHKAGYVINNTPIYSHDITSSYPAVMMYEKYPCSKFVKWDITTLKELHEFDTTNKAFLVKLHITNISTDTAIPYIPVSKCEYISFHNLKTDNGRVLFAEQMTIVINEIDFNIIANQYDCENIQILDFYFCDKEILPAELRETISHYYEGKTTLKGIIGKEYEYAKKKELLNGIFGMAYTDPVRDIYEIGENNEWLEPKRGNITECLRKFYKSRNSFLPYQIGAWCTAYARRNLQNAIDLIGDDIIYCDTDSVKYIGDYNIAKIHNLNNEIYKKAIASDIPCIYYTNNGKEKILGVWELDATYSAFITYGAKKYADVENEIFSLTVSGLNKKSGAIECGSIDNFLLGKVFTMSGRTVSYYNDDITPHQIDVVDYMGNKTLQEYRSNVGIVDTTYTLGISKEYGELIYLNRN